MQVIVTNPKNKFHLSSCVRDSVYLFKPLKKFFSLLSLITNLEPNKVRVNMQPNRKNYVNVLALTCTIDVLLLWLLLLPERMSDLKPY